MQSALSLPKLSSSDALAALGLEVRRSNARRLVNGLGVAAVGALVGAGAMLVGAVLLSRDRKSPVQPTSVKPPATS